MRSACPTAGSLPRTVALRAFGSEVARRQKSTKQRPWTKEDVCTLKSLAREKIARKLKRSVGLSAGAKTWCHAWRRSREADVKTPLSISMHVWIRTGQFKTARGPTGNYPLAPMTVTIRPNGRLQRHRQCPMSSLARCCNTQKPPCALRWACVLDETRQHRWVNGCGWRLMRHLGRVSFHADFYAYRFHPSFHPAP